MFVFVCVFAFLYPDLTGKKQIVRLKVQSNQDVNDPAVTLTILDQVGVVLHKTPRTLIGFTED